MLSRPNTTLLNHACGGPLCAAQFKQQPADFRVEEQLAFTADGEGPHWLVQVEKTDINTLDMLDEVARTFKLKRNTLGYSGLKDRFAITRQWLTFPAQGIAQGDVISARGEFWQVLACHAHRRKLRVGSHKHNSFEIVLRDVLVDQDTRVLIDQRLAHIALSGVPNYFGPQRFGRAGSNLRRAMQLFGEQRKLPRQQHRFAVSAARSMVFNALLSERVARNNWNIFIPGDLVMLNGSHSFFDLERLGEDGPQRLQAHDIHPSGAMWGKDEPATRGEALLIETQIAARCDPFAQGLARLGLKQERRALRLGVNQLEHSWSGNDLTVSFSLTTGGFATSVLREVVDHPELQFSFPEEVRQMLG